MSGYSDRTKEVARYLLRILIQRLTNQQQEETKIITYGELSRAINEVLETGSTCPLSLRYPLGFIRDEICIRDRLPLINLLVVNKQTGLPGVRALPENYSSNDILSLTNEVLAATRPEAWARLRQATQTEEAWWTFIRERRGRPSGRP